jgi:uncharacterized protein (TIGR02001 family)
MKKVLLSVVAALAVTAAVPAFAADMPVKAKKVVVATPSPWDIAVGTAFTTDYVLRGVSQSNHKAAVQGYFEVRYNINEMWQLYAGVWGSSLWTGLANAEIDPSAGVRLTLGNFGLDVGYVYYYYPGGITPVTNVPALGNGSYGEVYAKPSYKFNDMLTIGGIFETGFNNFNNKAVPLGAAAWVGDARHYFYAGNAMITLPWQPAGITVSINPEVGYEYYSSGVTANYGSVSDTYWDVGLILNYKAATLDLRYWGTNVKAGTGAVVNQCGGAVNGTNFCGDRFVATLKFDTTFSALK